MRGELRLRAALASAPEALGVRSAFLPCLHVTSINYSLTAGSWLAIHTDAGASGPEGSGDPLAHWLKGWT